MNAINWKKLILPNIPYLLFVYLFDKVGQAVRLAPGADLSGKVLSLGEGFSTAFTNPLPSLAPMDLLIGIFGAVLIRLIVYVKGKNAKKYRKGIEYGSARWGTAEDIKPYTDPVFQNNVLLTQTERLTMNSRPKQPKYARNKNILVIGGSGSGKTRFFVKPNLMQMHSSYVVTDPKGTVLVECGKLLQRGGYRIKVLNTINFKKSMRYNPFAYLRSEKDILKLVNTLIANTKGDGEKAGEDFWVKSERLFYCALIGYIWYEAPEEEKNFTTLLEMINASEARDSNYREWQDIQGLLDKIRSTGMGGISADDPQAVQKLEKKLESLEKSQESMKAVNAYYRKHKPLDGCPHLPPKELEKLKADMGSSWHLEDKPFATWALSNNSAEIRRVKDRIKSLSQQKEIGFVGWEFDGGKVEANTEANRLQIFFEDKPDEATREALKNNGFRWSPKAVAWQRQLTSNAYYAADYVKSIQPLTGEKPTELQRAHIRQQKVAAQEQPTQEQPGQEAPQDKDTFSIYQITGGNETRDLRFEPYDRLIATGHWVDPKNYALVYSAELTPGTSLEDIYTRFNIDHPKDFKGHSLSVSDVVVLHQNGQDTAHYVDSFGYKEVPEFLQPENYLKAAEQTTEQNYNMIDGQINNTPTAAELEEKAKTGGQISLAEYAEALKAEKEQTEPEKKPSIRAQLRADKEKTAQKKAAKTKHHDMEV